MSGKINKSDLISQEALESIWLELAKNIELPIKKIEEIINIARELDKNLKSSVSFKEINEILKKSNVNLENYIRVQNEFNAIIQKTNDLTRKLALTETEEYKALTKSKIALKEKNKAIKESITHEKRDAKIKKEQLRQEREILSAQKSLAAQKQKALNKQGIEEAKARALKGTYQGLNNELQKNILKYKNLAIQKRQNTKEGRALLSTIKSQQAAINKANGAFSKQSGTFKRLTTNLKSYAAAYLSVMGIINRV